MISYNVVGRQWTDVLADNRGRHLLVSLLCSDNTLRAILWTWSSGTKQTKYTRSRPWSWEESICTLTQLGSAIIVILRLPLFMPALELTLVISCFEWHIELNLVPSSFRNLKPVGHAALMYHNDNCALKTWCDPNSMRLCIREHRNRYVWPK